MFNPIEMRRRMVQERIEKSFDNEIEKAKHQVGEVHPNGKWIWTEYAPGKFDWKSKKGKYYKNGGSTASAASKTTEDKGYAERFKKNFKDASDDVLNKVISGKIQATDADKRLAKEILDERKRSAEGEKYAEKIIDLLKVSNNKYSDIKKVTAFKTNRGNWAIDYDGAYTGIILNGSKLSEKGLKAAGVKIEGANNEKKGVASNTDAGTGNKAFTQSQIKKQVEDFGAEFVVMNSKDGKSAFVVKFKDGYWDSKDFEKRFGYKSTTNVGNYYEFVIPSGGSSKGNEKKADKKSDDWNDNLFGYKTQPFEGAVKVADLKVGDKLVGKNGRTMTVIGVNKTKDGTDVGVKFDNPRIGDGIHWSAFNNNSYYGAKKAVDSYASMDIKDAKKALVGKVVTLVDYWPDGRGGSQDAIGEIKNVRLYGKNKTPIAEVVYPNGDEQMIRLDEIDDGKMKDSYKTSVTISDDKKKLDAIKNKIASSE